MKQFLREANCETLDLSAKRNDRIYVDTRQFHESSRITTASGLKC